MAKSIAVLGLGKFGRSLVRALDEMGADVLAVDKNETTVNEIADCCSSAVCADVSNEEALISLGLKDMDIVVVAMAQNLEASVLAVAVSKELGVPRIVAKSSSPRMSAILRRVGATDAIIPEEYAGTRSATILFSETVLDYFKIGSSLCMVEMVPLKAWIGKTLTELNLRINDNINVVARRDSSNHWMIVDPGKPIVEKSKLLVVMEQERLDELIRHDNE